MSDVGDALMGGSVELEEAEWDRIVTPKRSLPFRARNRAREARFGQVYGAIINISSLASTRWTGDPCGAYYPARAS